MEKANMKKTFLYAFVAIALGVSVMLFPLWTFFKRYNEQGIKLMSLSANWQNYTAESMSRSQTIQPADASLQILLIGVIVALIAYVVFRRIMGYPTYASPYGFPRW